VVQGDKRLLAIALENLLSNAWKFTANKPKGMIEFGITEYDKDIVYYVRDNGAGFDIKHAEKLFTPFQRLHSDEDIPAQGSGYLRYSALSGVIAGISGPRQNRARAQRFISRYNRRYD